ncbi:hypothetical protein SEUCBS140593_007806 [Sporothrix eucalyptigena]|uniref:ATP-dependent DNA ligase family profile domain-containing protein n=1 Tax=Sporothrix eucalyptigena TaxID=1812306 RepID=A0ABP0CJ04_9PEZI
MTFSFAHVCDLFQQVEDLPPARRSQPRAVNQVVQAWFATHRQHVDNMVLPAKSTSASTIDGSMSSIMSSTGPVSSATSPPSAAVAAPSTSSPAVAGSAAALLSTLLPERRTDRVYGLQARGLQRILITALGLGHSRIPELSRWMRACEHATTGPVDLADCVEAILQRTPNPVPTVPVSVEEVDQVLHSVAARCRFSAPAVRGNTVEDVPHTQTLTRLYQRIDPRGAKWLTRLILKDLRPVVLDETAVARAFHRDLPRALQVHADLEVAVNSLGENSGCVRPRLGTKVGRQQWAKGRSIQHCIGMAGPQRMSCEHKMDGEYVQVHVDLSKGTNCIQLFSKSGKDSTWDRVYLHDAIRDSLRLGQPDCPLTSGCILEGEMLAYDEKTQSILDFDVIRQHVNRSGSRLYADPRVDAAHRHEHLMIVYYDVLLIDNESLLGTRHCERFHRLEELVTCRAGYAELVTREVIDFNSHAAPSLLRKAFARCITARLEGLVLKPDNDPYFDFAAPSTTGPKPLEWPYLKSYVIKLKRGYIGGFGEVGDFAVLGGRYDAAKAREYPSDLPCLRWTHFFLGCLDTANSTPQRPRFVVTNVVTLTVAQMTTFLKHCRPRVVPVDKRQRGPGRPSRSTKNGLTTIDDPDVEVVAEQTPFDIAPLEPGLDDSKGGPSHLFAEPPVVEIRCFSFHRQGYGRFWSPRFPSVTKFHFDRTSRDAVTFDGLQTMAQEATTLNYDALDDDTQDLGDEHTHWVAKLKKADRHGIAMDAETSQSSAGTTATTRSQSQSAPVVASQAVTVPLAEIEEEDDADEKDNGQTQLSIVTIRTYDNDRYFQPRKKAAPVVTVIDLTGDDEDDEEEEDPSTPKQLPASLPLLNVSPATPVTPRAAAPGTPPQAASSPLPPASSSPIDFVSSLTAPSTDDSQESLGTLDTQGSGRSEDPTCEREARRAQSAPGTPSRKRRRSWDLATLYSAVSPVLLKRAKSGV